MGRIFKKDDIYWISYRYKSAWYDESSHSGDETVAQNLLKKREEDILCGIAPDVVIKFRNPKQERSYLSFKKVMNKKGRKERG